MGTLSQIVDCSLKHFHYFYYNIGGIQFFNVLKCIIFLHFAFFFALPFCFVFALCCGRSQVHKVDRVVVIYSFPLHQELLTLGHFCFISSLSFFSSW